MRTSNFDFSVDLYLSNYLSNSNSLAGDDSDTDDDDSSSSSDDDSDNDDTENDVGESIRAARRASLRTHDRLDVIPEAEVKVMTSIIHGNTSVEQAGLNTGSNTRPTEMVDLTDLRRLSDYPIAPSKHECAVIKRSLYARQVYALWKSADNTSRALLLGRAGQAGTDADSVRFTDEKDIANLHVPPHFKHLSGSDGILYSVATLHKFGIPYATSVAIADELPATCTCCLSTVLGPETQALTRLQRLWL